MNDDELIVFDPYGELKKLVEKIEQTQAEENERG